MNLESKQSEKMQGGEGGWTKNCVKTNFIEGRKKEMTAQEDILKNSHYSKTLEK